MVELLLSHQLAADVAVVLQMLLLLLLQSQLAFN